MMRTIPQLFLVAFFGPVSTVGMPARPQEASPRYDVVDLGSLPDCDVTSAEAVNNRGWVVGYALTHVSPGHGNLLSHPFLMA
jgi:hypothetical protein